MNLIVYAVFLIYLWILFSKKADFVFYIPIFHVVVDISFFYLGPASLATYYRGLVLLIFFYFIIKNFKYVFPLKVVILVFLGFTGLLALQSTEILYSVKGYSQVFFSMLMLPTGYILINTEKKLHKLSRQYIWLIILSVFITSLGYIFNIGKIFNYGEDEQKIGLLGSAGLYSGAVCIALLPILVNSLRRNWMRAVAYIASILLFIFILLNVRRTAIMIPFVGLIAFLFTTEKKLQYFSYVAATVLVLAIASIWYGDTLRERFAFREEAGRFEPDFYKTEGRYLEVVTLTAEVFSFKEPMASLFGIGNNIFAEHISENKIVRRMHHTDFGRLLYGAGIAGVILYLFFTIKLFFLADLNHKTRIVHIRRIKSMIFALALINLALMVNGSLNLITLKSVIFLYMGALLRIYYNNMISYRIKSSKVGGTLSISQGD